MPKSIIHLEWYPVMTEYQFEEFVRYQQLRACKITDSRHRLFNQIKYGSDGFWRGSWGPEILRTYQASDFKAVIWTTSKRADMIKHYIDLVYRQISPGNDD